MESSNLKRRGAGTLTLEDLGQTIKLQAWVHRRRDLGGLMFLNLRDRSGIAQVVVHPEEKPVAVKVLEAVRGEWVVEITGTVRTLREEVRDHVEAQLSRLVEQIVGGFGGVGKLDYIRHYPVTVNHEHETAMAAAAAQEVAGTDKVRVDMPPIMGGEDFSFMLNEVPGAMINVGNGPSAGLHHPEYNFNDEVAPVGASFFARLVERAQPLAAG